MAEGNAARQRAVARAPEEYSLKHNFTTWVKQFRNYTELLNVPVNQTYRTLLSFLNPECFNLVEALALPQDQREALFDGATFRRLKEALRSRENRINPGYLLKYRKQKEGESIEKYAEELIKLAEEVYPEDQNIRQNAQLIGSFVGGVNNDELAIKLLQENYDNLNLAVEAAVHYFQALQTRRFIKTETDFRPVLEKVYAIRETEQESVNTVHQAQPETPQTAQCNSTQNRQSKQNLPTAGDHHRTSTNVQDNNKPFVQQSWQPQFQMMPPNYPQYNHNMYQAPVMPQWYNSNQQMYGGPQYQGFPPPTWQQSQGQRSNGNRSVTCFYCSKKGHYKRDCRKLQADQSNQNHGYNQQSQNRQQKHCTYCDKRGHTADQCWHLKNQVAQNEQACQPNQQHTNPLTKNT